MAKKNRPNPGARYAQIPKEVVYSEAFKTLTGRAPHLLLIAACEYVGPHINGDIALPYTKYREYGFKCKLTMSRALEQLVKCGLLIVTRKGGVTSGHMPTLYALGWLPIPENAKLVDIATPAPISEIWRAFKITPVS